MPVMTGEVNSLLDGLPAILTFPKSQVEKPISPRQIGIRCFTETVARWRSF